MSHEYAFELKLINDEYQLHFFDLPKLIVVGKTPDIVFSRVQSQLDNYLYDLLKNSQPIPPAKTKAAQDKRIAPSEAITMALGFYLT